MAQIEEVFELNEINTYSIKGLIRMEKEDEFLKFIRLHYNISSFYKDENVTYQSQ